MDTERHPDPYTGRADGDVAPFAAPMGTVPFGKRVDAGRQHRPEQADGRSRRGLQLPFRKGLPAADYRHIRSRTANCNEDKRCGTVESRILPTSAMVRSSLLSLAPHYLLTSSDLSIATLAFDGDAPSLAGRAAHHFLAGNARAR